MSAIIILRKRKRMTFIKQACSDILMQACLQLKGATGDSNGEELSECSTASYKHEIIDEWWIIISDGISMTVITNRKHCTKMSENEKHFISLTTFMNVRKRVLKCYTEHVIPYGSESWVNQGCSQSSMTKYFYRKQNNVVWWY